MLALIYIALSCILLQATQSLKIRSEENSLGKLKGFRRVLENSAGSTMFLVNEQEPEPKSVRDILTQQLQEHERMSHKKRNHLRSLVTQLPDKSQVQVNTEHALLVEKELQDTKARQSAMLLETAYVQNKGPNDFLVLKDKEIDPFVTIIPNEIFYQPGTKVCVNWLDECSIEGIRARLLHRVRSP